MSYAPALVALLGPLVGGRIYPDEATTEQPGAYMLYQQVGGDAVRFLEPVHPGLRHARVQLQVWSSSRAASDSLARQAEVLLVEHPTLRAYAYGAAVSSSEPDLRLYGCMQDFGIWY